MRPGWQDAARRSFPLLIALSGLASLALGQQPSFSVRSVAGDEIQGSLAALDEQAVVLQVQDGASLRLLRDELLSLEPTAGLPLSDAPAELVLLTNGDCLAGTATRIADDLVTLTGLGSPSRGEFSVPLEYVRCVVLRQPEDERERARLWRQWALQTLATDRVWLTNGAHVDGEFAGYDGGILTIQTPLGPVETPRDEVAAIGMTAELAVTPRLPSQYAVLLAADGSRVTLADVRLHHSGELIGTSVAGSEIRLPPERVVRLQFFGERAVALAERSPSAYRFTPWLTQQHPLVRHRNVNGGPLRIRRIGYATGLGVHSQSEASYDVADAGFDTLTATIGVDDAAAGGGSVDFAVEVDGVRVYAAQGVTGTAEPIPIEPIDIADAREITLIVEFGGRGNIHDVADWCDPLLLKRAPPSPSSRSR